MNNNCVWYWFPARFSWCMAEIVPSYMGGTATTLEELAQECERAGYKAQIGRKDNPPKNVPVGA